MELIDDNGTRAKEAREWLAQHRLESGLSFEELARLTGLSSSTLSLFAAEKYQGSDENVATRLFAYRDRLIAQEAVRGTGVLVPDWYDTPTAGKIVNLLRFAQTGKFIVIVTVPGVGKTRTAERLAAADPNVWLATMSPSTAGVATMAMEVAEAVGLGEISGSPQQLSRKIRAHVKGKNGLLIIDEAHELTEKAINEIRSWHDRVGLGVALLGNEKVVGQIDARKSALAQVSSRVSMRHSQTTALPADVEAALDAWGITRADQRAFLHRIGALPGALREITHTLEIAAISLGGDMSALTLDRLKAAAKQRNVKLGAA